MSTRYRLLASALRHPVDSVSELASRLRIPEAPLRQHLDRLEEEGFLTVVHDVITYRRPDAAVARLTAKAVTDAATQLLETESQTKALLESLPGLLHAWQEGTADDHTLRADVIHGPSAASEIWRLRALPSTVDVCMPDASAGFQAAVEDEFAFWTQRRGERVAVRLLLSVADATHPAAQERIQSEANAGVELRMHPNLPSYFWVTDSDSVGLPLEWGQGWPTSVVAVTSPVIAAALSWVYERLWSESVPVSGEKQPWEGMLQLMSRGLTVEAAATTLGLTGRTGRRRVSEAMKHYGVRSQFSLGAAWGRGGP